MGPAERKDIFLGDAAGEVILYANHARMAVHADGSVETYTDERVRMHRALNDNGAQRAISPAELHPGDRMPDGTIYAGLSPDTDKPMYTMPQDAFYTYTFNEASEYAKQLNANQYFGH